MNHDNDNPNEVSSASQNWRILAYLREGETITSLEALKMFQCFRLASRMTDLKNMELGFDSVRIKTPTGKHVKAYFIPEAFAKKHGYELNGALSTLAAIYATAKISEK